MDPQHNTGSFQLLVTSTPPMISSSSERFGAYNFDELPSPTNLPDTTRPVPPGAMLTDESNEPKRQRIATACDMCRKKKIKCDGKIPACTHCIEYGSECAFTPVKKTKINPKGPNYIAALENRLRRMEGLLRLSGLLSEDGNGQIDLDLLEGKLLGNKQLLSQPPKWAPTLTDSHLTTPLQKSPNNSHGSRSRSGVAYQEPPGTNRDDEEGQPETCAEKVEGDIEALSDMMCSLVTSNCGETWHIGLSSGFSIFSPQGIQWVNGKIGDSSFQDIIASNAVDTRPQVFSDSFTRRFFRQLPPKQEAASLLQDYFDNFNCMTPLFHQATIMNLFDREYSGNPCEGPGWWASLNVVLAIAHRLRVMSRVVPAEDDQKAWGYLKNAMTAFSDLVMRNTDLLSIQALIGLALFLQGTPSPQPGFFLIAAAIRLSHSIGLHKQDSGLYLSPAEVQQRQRVFWIAYMLDKDTSLRSGRPPLLDDDDMDVDLPSAEPDDNIGNIPLADCKGNFNLFRTMCEFTIIEGRVYKQLYSTKAAKKSDGELLDAIGNLDHQLQKWKDGIPDPFRPENDIISSHTPLILHVVVLHFAYYNCLTTIHRMSVQHGYWTSRLSDYAIQGLNAGPLNPRVFSSSVLCVSAARASIHLLKYVPPGDSACVWLILYYPVSSLVTLFTNILQNSQDPLVRSDLHLMSLVIEFLSLLNAEVENGGIRKMLGVCVEFERIARRVLDGAEKGLLRRKRKTHANEPAQNPTALSQSNNGMDPAGGVPLFGISNAMSPAFELNAMASSGSSISGPQCHDAGAGNGSWTPVGSAMASLSDSQGYTNGASTLSFLNLGVFQQPFVPQHILQMPMALESDWADIIGGSYLGAEDGQVDLSSLYTAE